MLEIGTKGRYAARLLVYLALNSDKGIINRSELATAEDISKDYVEQIMLKLKAEGFVRSHRGARGGYSLGCDPAEVSVLDILAAMEGNFSFAPCLEDDCRRCMRCVTRPVWKDAVEAFTSVLKTATIAKLASRAEEAIMKEGRSYTI